MSTAPFHVFANGILALGAKLENVSSDTLKCLLLTSAYNPSGVLDTAEYVQDVITAGGVEVSAGGGYSTGGVSLASVTWAVTAANSWGTARANTTAYNVGDIVIPASPNGYLYQAAVAGTSGGSAPTYPTVVGTTVADSGVTWLCIGTAVTVLSAANMVWTSSGGGFSAAYGLVYDSTPASYSSDPVIGYYDFGGTLSPSSGGTLTITVPPAGILPLPTS